MGYNIMGRRRECSGIRSPKTLGSLLCWVLLSQGVDVVKVGSNAWRSRWIPDRTGTHTHITHTQTQHTHITRTHTHNTQRPNTHPSHTHTQHTPLPLPNTHTHTHTPNTHPYPTHSHTHKHTQHTPNIHTPNTHTTHTHTHIPLLVPPISTTPPTICAYLHACCVHANPHRALRSRIRQRHTQLLPPALREGEEKSQCRVKSISVSKAAPASSHTSR